MPGFHGWANDICRGWNVLNCNRAVADTPAFQGIVRLAKWYSWSRLLKSSPHFSHIPSRFLEGFSSRWESVLWYMCEGGCSVIWGACTLQSVRVCALVYVYRKGVLWPRVHTRCQSVRLCALVYVCGKGGPWSRVHAHCQPDNWIKGENTKSVQRKAKCVSSRTAVDWGHTSTCQKAIGERSRAEPSCRLFRTTVSCPEKKGAYGERQLSAVLQNSFAQRLTCTGLNS